MDPCDMNKTVRSARANVSQDGHFFNGIVQSIVDAAAGDVILRSTQVVPPPVHFGNAYL
ncbi:unnamed protein product [Taenia asiatica]|uniref:Molybdopterin molybdenumtransferase MoeA n=1 Tax=Taenia asiatica TaxID=60517 RepID=A0A0R3VZH4_TAEAS|nr:unnamed protein product [Taenia asiatica]